MLNYLKYMGFACLVVSGTAFFGIMKTRSDLGYHPSFVIVEGSDSLCAHNLSQLVWLGSEAAVVRCTKTHDYLALTGKDGLTFRVRSATKAVCNQPWLVVLTRCRWKLD